jgi:tRNA U34 5-carboxymethylaminomethyl modifying GTPase MnmE/TrmE
MPERPTIFALSSGRGPAAIAVIRISGSRAGDALKALGVKVPAPHSETGENVVELQPHDGLARDHHRTEKRIRLRRRSNSLIGPVVSR